MMQLSVVSVPVTDLKRATAFYRDVLGFRIEAQSGRDERPWTLMMPQAGATGISLIPETGRMKAGGLQGLMLRTLDAENVREKLIAKGLSIGPVTQASWGRFAAFEDPDGNGWVLAEASLGA